VVNADAKAGHLSDGEKAFLIALYGAGGLGGRLFEIPKYIKDHGEFAESANQDQKGKYNGILGTGLLALSREDLIGPDAFSKLPQELRDLLSQSVLDPNNPDHVPNAAGGAWLQIHHPEQWNALVDILGPTLNDHPPLAGGREFSRDLTYRLSEIADFSQTTFHNGGQAGQDSLGRWGLTGNVLYDHQAGDAFLSTLLDVSTRNHAADLDVLNGVGWDPNHPAPSAAADNGKYHNPLVTLFGHDWLDNGATASHLIDWIGPGRENGDPYANDAAKRLFELVGSPHQDGGVFDQLTNLPNTDGNTSLGGVNPKIAQALGSDIAGYIDVFADDPGNNPADGHHQPNGPFFLTEGDRLRALQLAVSDPDSAIALEAAAQGEAINAGQHAAHHGVAGSIDAQGAGRLIQYVDRAIGYEATNRQLTDQQRASEAYQREQQVNKVINYVLGAPSVLFPEAKLAEPQKIAQLIFGIGTQHSAPTVDAPPLTLPVEYTSQHVDNGTFNVAYGEAQQLVHDGKITQAQLDTALAKQDDSGHVKIDSHGVPYSAAPTEAAKQLRDLVAHNGGDTDAIDSLPTGYSNSAQRNDFDYNRDIKNGGLK
jgi:hypothetical protein